jgi:hypothetical protein
VAQSNRQIYRQKSGALPRDKRAAWPSGLR